MITGSPGAVDVRAMFDPQHDYLVRGVVDPVDDAVSTTTGCVATVELALQLLTDTLGIVKQRAGDELDHRSRDSLGQRVLDHAGRWSRHRQLVGSV